MKIVDLSHVMNVHTPGWVGYAGNKMYYAENLQTQMIVAQRIEMALHVGTHFDGAMHATDGRTGDMASLPLDYLVNRGVVVDISAKCSDWSVITPGGTSVPIGSDVVLLGRRPKLESAHPGAQLISIDDGTVSKTHARLELRGDTWWVTDLNSTNGTVVRTQTRAPRLLHSGGTTTLVAGDILDIGEDFSIAIRARD